MLSLTRVAAISSSDRDAAVMRRSRVGHVPGGNEQLQIIFRTIVIFFCAFPETPLNMNVRAQI